MSVILPSPAHLVCYPPTSIVTDSPSRRCHRQQDLLPHLVARWRCVRCGASRHALGFLRSRARQTASLRSRPERAGQSWTSADAFLQLEALGWLPENWSHSPDVGLMLCQRRRRWPNIKTKSGQCIEFSGLVCYLESQKVDPIVV